MDKKSETKVVQRQKRGRQTKNINTTNKDVDRHSGRVPEPWESNQSKATVWNHYTPTESTCKTLVAKKVLNPTHQDKLSRMYIMVSPSTVLPRWTVRHLPFRHFTRHFHEKTQTVSLWHSHMTVHLQPGEFSHIIIIIIIIIASATSCVGRRHNMPPPPASWQYPRIYSPGGTCSGMLAI